MATTYRDTSQYISFMRRVVKAAGKRTADADPEQLAELVALQADLEDAIAQAVAGLRSSGSTWQDIGDAVGTTRQAAFQRWAARVA